MMYIKLKREIDVCENQKKEEKRNDNIKIGKKREW